MQNQRNFRYNNGFHLEVGELYEAIIGLYVKFSLCDFGIPWKLDTGDVCLILVQE